MMAKKKKKEVSCCASCDNVNWRLYQRTQVISHLNMDPNWDCVINLM